MSPSEKNKFISNWIKSYVDQMPVKAQSLVIGISGGIDSSVSSTLSAMTGIKTIVLTMPIRQKNNQHDLSLKHQEWLTKKFKNVEAHTVSLDKLLDSFSSSLKDFDNEHGFANSRARLRMTTLYQVAAANKGIVVGTGNKVEASPTDGLWDDGRTDEGQLGFKYEDLEEAMKNPNSPHRQEYEKIRKQNLHKMEPIPVCKIPS